MQRESGRARGQTTTVAPKLNYLESESDYIGDLSYDIELPIPLADHKQLNYPLAKEIFCSYRPTTLELQSIYNLAGISDTGPPVDLIDPIATYSSNEAATIAPEDSILLQSLVPGVIGRTITTTPTTSTAVPTTPTKAKSQDKVASQFGTPGTDIVHPQKPELKPLRQGTDKPFLLEAVDAVSQRLRTFALYERDQNSNDDKGYVYVRDFIAKFPDVLSPAHRNLIFDMPISLDTHEIPSGTPPPEEVYFVPLPGPKVLFTKVTEPTRRHRESVQLVPRPLTAEEDAEEKRLWRQLQKPPLGTVNSVPGPPEKRAPVSSEDSSEDGSSQEGSFESDSSDGSSS